MTDRLNNFKQKFPNFLSKLDCLEHDAGWDALLEKFFVIVEEEILHYVPEDLKKDIFAVQIKEKFGALRIYCNKSTPFIDGAISLAEILSTSICEICGNSGTIKSMGYIRTLCDPCFNNRKR